MSTETGITILGIAGSLRQSSWNRALLRAAQEVAPVELTIEIFDISGVPLYNEDVRKLGFPPAVRELRDRIGASDGVLIATPEYNYAVPGVLKNAIDWASRPPDQPFQDKPIALIGASAGAFGTTRAQHHLRQSFVYLDARVMTRPEVQIPSGSHKFDQFGNLTDAASRQQIADLLASFVIWIRRLSRAISL